MRLVVLGCSGTYPRPGGACNGYLVQEGGKNLVLDLGNGCMSNLLEEVDFTGLDAVVISHMHIDHFGDLYPLYYALRFHPDEPWGLRVLLPEGGLELMGRILGDDARAYLPKVFRTEPLSEEGVYEVGDMKLTFYPTVHPVEGYSVRVEGGDWKLAYSSDTSPCPGLLKAAEDADIFICEATMPAAYLEEAAHGHLTSVQAAEAAEEAGAGMLVLTHIWPTFDKRDILEEVKGSFSGEVMLAYEGCVLSPGGVEDAQE